jgi:hypothetical protein
MLFDGGPIGEGNIINFCKEATPHLGQNNHFVFSYLQA